MPQENGQPLPLWFPFSRSYWCPHSGESSPTEPSESHLDDDDQYASVPFEPVDTGMERQKSIEIANLRKTFDKKLAVDGLTMTMFYGQITALLGHNGAGVSLREGRN